MAKPLKFKFAPHILEDLGLNLYTSLARVLVEYVANAYDADGDWAHVMLRKSELDEARRIIKQQYEDEREQFEADNKKKKGALPLPVVPLAHRELPAKYTIEVIDNGHGMSRDDLDEKFLVAGRRRRVVEESQNGRSPKKKRPLLGRKGLGKLAGFGVAKKIVVISRKSSDEPAIKISLDYDDLLEKRTTDQIEIPAEEIDEPEYLTEAGTHIILSRLMYEPTKNRESTVINDLTSHFEFVETQDFSIYLDDDEDYPIEPDVRVHNWAWPSPSRPTGDLVTHKLDVPEADRSIEFDLRLTVRHLQPPNEEFEYTSMGGWLRRPLSWMLTQICMDSG